MENEKSDTEIQEEDLSVLELNERAELVENPVCVCTHRYFNHNSTSLDYREAPITFCCIKGCECKEFLDVEIAEQQKISDY